MFKKVISTAFCLLISVYLLQAQYITEILEYKPAPGQFTNTSYASPEGATSIIGGIQGAVSLGAFGGYIVFKFESPVQNDPDNPFGVDFTVFGNPMKNPVSQEITWSEHGVVSVMKDENNNGLPDDTWYELAGSDYFFSSTLKNYAVTYINPQQSVATNVPWSDNQGNSGFILANEYHEQPYYPTAELFPDINTDEYTLTGTRLPDEVDKSNPSSIKLYAKAFGYADNKPRNLNATYTIPDNPYTSEQENSGGDAFDINWAVDENGNYVDLDEIHFVKIHTGVLADAGWLGEVSTEIAGAVDVSPNSSISGVTDILVLKDLPDTINSETFPIEIFSFQNGRYQPDAPINWNLSLSDASINEENILSCSSSGKIVITASLADNPSITATDSTYWLASGTYISEIHPSLDDLRIYPNPSSEYFMIEGVNTANIVVYDVTGNEVLHYQQYQTKNKIWVNDLEKGVYIVNVSSKKGRKSLRFVKL